MISVSGEIKVNDAHILPLIFYALCRISLLYFLKECWQAYYVFHIPLIGYAFSHLNNVCHFSN